MRKVEALSRLQAYAAPLRALGATSLYMFGSTGRDNAGPASDIDLFVDYDPSGRFNLLDLVAAKRLIEEGLGVAVDITTRHGLHPLIRDRIEAEATRVF
jgi:hypothetical protein